MKITITESQYKKIGLLVENQQYLDKFKSFCVGQQPVLTSIYRKVTSLGVSEILAGTDLNAMQKQVSDIESMYYTHKRTLNTMYPDPDETFDDMMDALCYPLTDKVDALNDLLDALNDLQSKQERYNFSDKFPDAGPMDIQSF